MKNLRIDFTQVVTNKCPVGPNRGYSRMQHLWFLERVVDICAHELNIPADEMRLRNYIRPEEFPYITPNGCVYDSGNYPGMMQVAKDLIDWDKWQVERTKARAEGRWLGIGIGTTLDSGAETILARRRSSIRKHPSPATRRRPAPSSISTAKSSSRSAPCRKVRGTRPRSRKWSPTS